MKKVFLLSTTVVLLFSCTKDVQSGSNAAITSSVKRDLSASGSGAFVYRKTWDITVPDYVFFPCDNTVPVSLSGTMHVAVQEVKNANTLLVKNSMNLQLRGSNPLTGSQYIGHAFSTTTDVYSPNHQINQILILTRIFPKGGGVPLDGRLKITIDALYDPVSGYLTGYRIRKLEDICIE